MQRLFAVSSAAQKFVEVTCHIPCEVLPNPIKLKNFKGAKGFSQYADRPTIVYLNRLVVRKGAMHLLQAVQYLRDNKLYTEPFRVVVCGKGEETQRLQAFIATNKLENIVTMTGFVSEKDKPRYLASADIVAYPSTGGESFGIVLLEGMASSKGVVLAGNNPGYASVMAPKPEQLVNPKDTKAFAERLAHYLQNPAERAAAATWQKQYVKQFDITVVGRELVKAYRASIAEKHLHSKTNRKYDTIEV
jgi:phosphatidylinositol alpha-mannosyltransferase